MKIIFCLNNIWCVHLVVCGWLLCLKRKKKTKQWNRNPPVRVFSGSCLGETSCRSIGMRMGWRRWSWLRLWQRRRRQRQRHRPLRTTVDGCGDRVGGRPWNRAGCCSWRSCPATCGPPIRPNSTTKLPLRCSPRPRRSVLL